MEREMVADVAQIYRLWNAYTAACQAGDLAGWLATWASNGQRMAPNAPASIGLEEIRAAVAPLFELFDFEAFTVNPEEVRVLGNHAYAHGTFTLSMTPLGEDAAIEDRGKFLTILKKQVDGSWKIAIDCFNSDLPAPSCQQGR